MSWPSIVACCAQHLNGTVVSRVDTQGDAFFIAFPTAPAALKAAREAQEELALPVRMGLHTGIEGRRNRLPA
jgi:class 3 adenylate cyclase